MQLQTVQSVVRDTPHMTLVQAERMSELIRENHFRTILELGFRHGVSTCYLAAALQAHGGGKVVTIDLEAARHVSPSIVQLLSELHLSDYVDVHFEPTSYTWRLMRFLEQDPVPLFDLCYIDGAHNWFVDGFAFFLVDKLLRPGGLMVFDDLDWTYANSPSLRRSNFVQNMPPDERTTPQVRKVYELLVKTQPGYGEFMAKDNWAYARKLSAGPDAKHELIQERIFETKYIGLGGALVMLYQRLSR
jgi:predicted O-methyltransferase YrrM